ncbi:MAG: CPBP family glutamic-type intramembrane protease [Candidatus Omnitrophota bacterium]
MDVFSSILLFVIIFWDAQLLRRYNPEHFYNVFRLPMAVAVVSFCGAILLAGFFNKPFNLLVYFFLAGLVPVYLSKRSVFLYTDRDQPLDFLIGQDSVTKAYTLFEWFKVVILSLYSSMLFEIIFEGMLKYASLDLSEISRMMISIIFLSILSLVFIYRSAINFSPEGFWLNVGFRKDVSKIKSVLVPVILGIFFVGFSSLIVINRGENNPSTPMAEVISTAGSPLILIIFIAWAWFVAPLFEEIVFRGYSFHIFKKVKGQRFAIYVIAGSFALLHIGQYWGDWLAILMVTLLAFTLTLLRAWSGTTQAGLVLHYIYNIGVTIVPVVILTLNNPYYFEYQAKYTFLDTTQKEELLLKSIVQKPDFSAAYNDLAWLYSQENIKVDEALRLIDRALELSPDTDAYLDTKAEVLELLGEYHEALAIRQKIVETSQDQKIIDMQKDRIEHLQELIEPPQESSDFLRVRFNSFKRVFRIAISTGFDIKSSHPIL